MILKDDTRLIITLGFCAILALMSLMISIALRQLKDINDSMSNLVEETNAKTEAANSMRDSIRLRSISLKTMALKDDLFERDEEYMRFIGHSRIYREAREKLLSKSMDKVEAEIHAMLSEATRIAQPLNEHVAELLLSGASKTEISTAIVHAAKHQEILLDLLNDLVDLERISAKRALKSANEHYFESRNVMFLLGAVALLFGLFIAFLVVRRSAEQNRHIYHQANHDALTGLMNRRAFEKELKLLERRPEGSESDDVLLYLDLDQFKIVNDTCGHMAGDELLRQLTEVFTKCLRQTDIFARLGGDEFGVLLKACNIDGATRVAEALRESAENFQFSWKGKVFSIGVSIGAVPVKQGSTSMATILSTADIACLEAKHTGRNRVHVADIDDQHIVNRRSEMDCVGLIKQALQDDRLCLYCQSVIPVERQVDQADHIEILVRMIDNDGKLVQPGLFIPPAERYGLMCAIDKWVLKHATNWLQEWKQPHMPPKLMINLSGQSVCDESFLAYAIEILDSTAIRPGSICFEITETAAIANLEKAASFMDALNDRGCEFALDDFGSGLSSFTYLKSLPVDYLKIDGAFVREITNDPIDYSMVKSINDIGHVMKKKTIAEFVEDDATLELLKEIGVDYAQGYGIALPIPLDELVLHTITPGYCYAVESGSGEWCQGAALANIRNTTP